MRNSPQPFDKLWTPTPGTLDEPLRARKPRRILVSEVFDHPFEFIAAVYGVMAACPQHKFIVLTKRPKRMREFFEWRWRPTDVPPTGRTPGGHPARMIGGVKGWENSDPSRAMADCVSWAYEFGGDYVRDKLTDAVPITVAAPLPNVWHGTSIAEQKDADRNIPILLKVPSAIRFISAEPLIGPIDLTQIDWSPSALKNAPQITGVIPNKAEPDDWRYECQRQAIQWVIVGGESGPRARPCDVAWIRSIVSQCKSAGLPCFVKQVGSDPRDSGANYKAWPAGACVANDRKGGDPSEWPSDIRVREWPDVAATS